MLGMGESAAVVASHAALMVPAGVGLWKALPWLRARWRRLAHEPAGPIVLAAAIALCSQVIEAPYYSTARIVHHLTPEDMWFNGWAGIVFLLRLLPLLAAIVFVIGCWRMLDGHDWRSVYDRATAMILTTFAVFAVVLAVLI